MQLEAPWTSIPSVINYASWALQAVPLFFTDIDLYFFIYVCRLEKFVSQMQRFFQKVHDGTFLFLLAF